MQRARVSIWCQRTRFFIACLLGGMLLFANAAPSLAQDVLPFEYKAKNLKPEDFGFQARTWEMLLRKMNGRMDEAENDMALLRERAIAYREYGVRRSLLLRKRDWKRSRRDFETLLASDSSYEDIHFQYGLLNRYEGNLEAAIAHYHTHLQLVPDAAYVHVALFRLYHQFLDEKPADVSRWIEANPSEYAAYLNAEQLRRNGQLPEADAALSTLLKEARHIPLQPVLLARARVYFALDQPAIATSFVNQAIDIIQNQTGAWLVFEDFKHILTNAEGRTFFTLDTAAVYQSFFREMLARRNPLRAQNVNKRLVEHYRRLHAAEKTYAFYQPREAYRVGNNARADRMADGDFPFSYWLNGEFGDKGLIFLRHGEPATTAASVGEGSSFLESWRYYEPALDFHFEGHGKLAELVPTLPLVLEVLEAREIWGGIYARLASVARVKETGSSFGRGRQTEMDFIAFGNEFFDENLESVNEGLASDRHKWIEPVQHMPVPYFLAAFNGAQDTTEVEIYFSVPIGQISNTLPDRASLGIEVGLTVHDMDWNEVYHSFETLTVDASRAKDAVAVDFLRFSALPDSYHVNLHASIADAPWIGSYQFDYTVPDYEPGSGATQPLQLSDLIPAFEVVPAERPGRYTKQGLYLRTNPGRGYRPEDPFFVYFEIYNLTFSSDDATDFEITYVLQPPETGRRRGVFRRKSKDPLLSITFQRSGAERTSVEYGEIDMSAVPAGRYELQVIVKDNNTGATASSKREIELG
ncbi:MAG: hypothetical protein AAF564_06775 [Bacteroidota bacterium]